MWATYTTPRMTLKPLKECIKSYRERIRRDYDSADTGQLFDIIIDCDTKLFTETLDSSRVDAMRAVIWFANAALTRRGLSPRSRECLGPVPTTAKRLLHAVRKADAPYLDLQWLGHRQPECLPKNWSEVKYLAATAPGSLTTSEDDDIIVLSPSDNQDFLDLAFDAAERLVNRRDSIADICRRLKLSPAAQAEHRWLCSRKTAQLLREIEIKELELRKEMRKQGIKQLSSEQIEQRLLIIRAWKLAGGGSKWQATADTYQAMTGKPITRQGIRDMITRLSEQKFIRLRRGRRKMLKPILSGE